MRSYPTTLQYINKPIWTLSALSSTLRLPVERLLELAANSNLLYREAKPIEKSDGSFRQPVDALPPLKSVHRRIKESLLYSVDFPEYLTGSIRGRDAKRNAGLHVGAAIVVCEDVEKFFPSTSSKLVLDIWEGFFGFSPDVAEVLTRLTTRHGALPEGAITSSYLANLAFWRREPGLHRRLKERGMAYSRFVDDITLSSKVPLSTTELTWAISQIYGMMRSCGFKAKRRKQEINRGCAPMVATKLIVNRKVALPSHERQAIRSAVYHLERRLLDNALGCTETEINSIAGRIARLGQMHPREAEALKRRLAVLREKGLNMPGARG